MPTNYWGAIKKNEKNGVPSKKNKKKNKKNDNLTIKNFFIPTPTPK
jgi:hypothetical protein